MNNEDEASARNATMQTRLLSIVSCRRGLDRSECDPPYSTLLWQDTHVADTHFRSFLGNLRPTVTDLTQTQKWCGVS